MTISLRRKLITAGILLVCVVTFGTVGYYTLAFFARHSPPWTIADCLYMTVITLTTVGFGEVIDVSNVPGARLFTVLVLLSGLGVSAYFISSLTAFLVEGELTNVFWRKRMSKEIAKLDGHIIVCGTGRVGHYIVGELLKTKRQLVAVEQDEQKIMDLQKSLGFFPAIIGDATHDGTLREAGVERASGIIATLSDDKDNLCVVVTCKQINPRLQIISRCRGRQFAKKLELVGAKAVIPNFIGGLRMASQMIRPRVVRYLDIMLRETDKVMRIEEVTVPEKSELLGRPIESVNLKQFGNLLLLAVMPPGDPEPHYNPDPSYIINSGDTLVFQADLDALDRFRKKYA